MKGLLKNNFYAVCSGAKIFAVFLFLFGAFATIVVSPQLLLFYMLLGIIGFSMNANTGMGKDSVSRWARYKITAPVRRTDIIKSYFFSQLIWMFVGMFFAGTGMSLSWLLHGCPFDRSIDALLIFAVGISISLFAGAIYFPLFYLGGEERSFTFLIISLLCAIGIVMGLTTGINRMFGPHMTTLQILLEA